MSLASRWCGLASWSWRHWAVELWSSNLGAEGRGSPRAGPSGSAAGQCPPCKPPAVPRGPGEGTRGCQAAVWAAGPRGMALSLLHPQDPGLPGGRAAAPLVGVARAGGLSLLAGGGLWLRLGPPQLEWGPAPTSWKWPSFKVPSGKGREGPAALPRVLGKPAGRTRTPAGPRGHHRAMELGCLGLTGTCVTPGRGRPLCPSPSSVKWGQYSQLLSEPAT